MRSVKGGGLQWSKVLNQHSSARVILLLFISQPAPWWMEAELQTCSFWTLKCWWFPRLTEESFYFNCENTAHSFQSHRWCLDLVCQTKPLKKKIFPLQTGYNPLEPTNVGFLSLKTEKVVWISVDWMWWFCFWWVDFVVVVVLRTFAAVVPLKWLNSQVCSLYLCFLHNSFMWEQSVIMHQQLHLSLTSSVLQKLFGIERWTSASQRRDPVWASRGVCAAAAPGHRKTVILCWGLNWSLASGQPVRRRFQGCNCSNKEAQNSSFTELSGRLWSLFLITFKNKHWIKLMFRARGSAAPGHHHQFISHLSCWRLRDAPLHTHCFTFTTRPPSYVTRQEHNLRPTQRICSRWITTD